MRAGDLTALVAPDDPLRSAEYYRRAVACATSDADRAAALHRLTPLYAARLELAQARKITEETIAVVQDPAIKKELQPILDDLIKKQDVDVLRVEKEQREVEDTRKRGTLTHFQAQLKAARARKAPASEIEALDRMVQQLQRQLTE
jgi:hypothetical protein